MKNEGNAPAKELTEKRIENIPRPFKFLLDALISPSPSLCASAHLKAISCQDLIVVGQQMRGGEGRGGGIGTLPPLSQQRERDHTLEERNHAIAYEKQAMEMCRETHQCKLGEGSSAFSAPNIKC